MHHVIIGAQASLVGHETYCSGRPRQLLHDASAQAKLNGESKANSAKTRFSSLLNLLKVFKKKGVVANCVLKRVPGGVRNSAEEPHALYIPSRVCPYSPCPSVLKVPARTWTSRGGCTLSAIVTQARSGWMACM